LPDSSNNAEQLRAEGIRLRQQFLKAEVMTCSTMLEMAEYELSVRNQAEAVRQIAAAEKGMAALERFVSDQPAEVQHEIDVKVGELGRMLERLKDRLRSARQ
jgi:predicted mannosyl-3-phosphoglycerate phosphatase (HAD superfamily)